MALQSFLISGRDGKGRGVDPAKRGRLTCLASEKAHEGDPAAYAKVSHAELKRELLARIAERQQRSGRDRGQLAVYLHGYHNDFDDAVEELAEMGHNLERRGFEGVVVGFTWPSEGRKVAYLEDRDDARESVTAFVHLMHLLREVRLSPEECTIDVSLLAHSMGNYVVREGLAYFWKHIGYPGGDTYFAQTLMFGADISYGSLEAEGSGEAIVALSHRVTAYYSHHDGVLGISRNYKHFGTRRLGRSGPRDIPGLPERVVAVDCSPVATPEAAEAAETSVHSCYRVLEPILDDFIHTMNGTDRAVTHGRAPLPGTNRRGYRLIGD